MATDSRAWILAGVLLALAGNCSRSGEEGRPAGVADRPDIVLLIADDLGWGDLSGGPMGHRTPRLDRLAREGLTFDRFYTFPICTPARAAILTGRSPARYGLLYGPLRPWEGGGLPPRERTLAELLRDAGYETALVGKWHLGHARRETWPQAQGFEHFLGCLNGSVDYFTRRRDGGLDWQQDGHSLDVEGYTTDLIAEAALLRLRERDPERPLFLVVSFTAPHTPFEAPAERIAEEDASLDETHRTLAAMVSSLDTAVGRIVDEVDTSGRAERTLIWFLSDNGAPGEAAAQGAGPAYPRNAPWRGGKWTVYEGGLRVPAFLRWPGRTPAGSRTASACTVLDLLPTLAAVAGVPVPSDRPLDGRNRVALLRGGEGGSLEGFFAGVEHFGVRRHAFLRGRWKLVQERRGRPRPQNALYDLGADPEEARDLAGQHPQVLQELLEEIRLWRDRYPRKGLHFTAEPPEGWQAPADWAAAAR